MAMKGRKKRHLTFFLCLVGFCRPFPLTPGLGVCCECGRCVRVFVGLWGRRGCFFHFGGCFRLCGGLVWCIFMWLHFLCLVRRSGMGFRGFSRVACGFVGLHVHVPGVKFCVEVGWFYFVICMAEFGEDGFIPGSHPDGFRFC